MLEGPSELSCSSSLDVCEQAACRCQYKQHCGSPRAWAGSWAEGGGALFWSSDDGSYFLSCWHHIGSGLNLRASCGLLSFHTLGIQQIPQTLSLQILYHFRDRSESEKALVCEPLVQEGGDSSKANRQRHPWARKHSFSAGLGLHVRLIPSFRLGEESI